MKYSYITNQMRRGSQITLLLAILLFNLGAGAANTVYAEAPSNDNFDFPEIIDQIIYKHTVDTTQATLLDSTDPDNVGPCDEDNRYLNQGRNSVWYTYTPVINETIAVDTIGSTHASDPDLDTYIAVWTGTEGNLTLIACDDDNSIGRTSQLAFPAQANTTYYFEIATFNCLYEIFDCGPTSGGNLVFNAKITNTHVTIADDLKGRYYLESGFANRVSFAGVNQGFVLVEGSNDQPFIAAMGVNYKQSGKFVSYSQTMGFPADQATTEYIFPRYTFNSNHNTQLRVANVGAEETTVEIYIGGILRGSPIFLAPGEAKLVPTIKSLDAGPVRVVSTNPAVGIIASMRVIYKYNTKNVSYSELMGYPSDQLTTAYVFPWYVNNTNLKSQLRVANMGAGPTDVQIYINGVLKKTYAGLAEGKSVVISVSGKGTMRVVSTNPIIASLRQLYLRNSAVTSYSELMGYPEDQLTTKYAFPWYTNNSSMITKFRIANMGAENTTVEIYVGGTLKGSHTVEAGKSILSPSYSGLNIGPVRVDSTNLNVDILVSMQITYKQSGVPVSYSEMMGYPYLSGQPTTSYLFPWYTNNSNIKSQLLFGYP